MADSSSGSDSTPTSVIASEFIRAYYNALSNEPQSLYAFYEEDSKFSRFEEGEISDHAVPAQGQLAIHESVCSLPYNGCKVRIETTDCHDSAFGSVVVIVTGIIVLSNQHPRTFVQTFVLQPLVAGSSHYYVRNDIMRYTSKITPTTVTSTPLVANHVPVVVETTPQPQSRPSSPKKQNLAAPPSPQAAPLRAPPSPVKPVAEPIVTPEPLPVRPVSPAVPKSPQRTPEPVPVAATASSPPPEEIPIPVAAAPSPSPSPSPSPAAAVPAESKPQRVRKVKREKPAPAPETAPAQAATAAAPVAAAPVELKQEQKQAPVKAVDKPKAVAKPAPVQPPRPSTWASRLFNAAKDGPAGAAKPEETTEGPADTPTSTTAPHVNGDTAPAPAQQATAEQTVRKPRSNKRPSSGKPEGYKQVELHSLWVNNIPPSVTQPELTALFSQFGSLRPIRVVAGKTYCFVDYYAAEGADSALAARPLRIQGAELSVDKKLVKQTPTQVQTGTATETSAAARPRPTSAAPKQSTTTTTTTTTASAGQLEDGFQKPTAGRSRAYKQRVNSENKAAAAQAAGAPTQVKKVPPTNGAPRK